jgi:hypothetical protein
MKPEVLNFVKENQSEVEKALELIKNKKTYTGDNAENIRTFLLQEHSIEITNEQVERIRSVQSNGILLFPVVVNAEKIHKRIVEKVGEAYNHPKDMGVSINTAIGFDRRTSKVYILGVNDSSEPDADLRINWKQLTTEKPDIDVLRITEYMNLYDYVLITRDVKLDTGTLTRTASPYFYSGHIPSSDTNGGKFRLGYSVRDDGNSNGGFRAVSVMLVL